MKRIFKVEKLSIEALLGLLMDLYEKGMDFVDLTADHSDPSHDKLIIMTRDEYINPEAKKQMDEEGQNIDDVFPEHSPENKKKFRDEHPNLPAPYDSGEADEDDVQPPGKRYTIDGKKLTDDDIDDLI